MSAKPGNRALLLATGVMAGLAIGWLTAPRRGSWLRNQARQKLDHARRHAGRRLYKRRKDFANRLRGSLAVARETLSRALQVEPPSSDPRTVVDRVHSQLGRQFARTLQHANLSAVGHIVYIHGYLPSELERERLVEAIARVEGVEAVRADTARIGHPGRSARVTEFPLSSPRRRAR